MISPGKRFSISTQREVFCISTPRRSPRINPASLRALKCCERVDFGMACSLTFRKFEQFCEHPEPDDIGKDRHPHRIGERVQDGLDRHIFDRRDEREAS
jgi:hypothetical protein